MSALRPDDTERRLANVASALGVSSNDLQALNVAFGELLSAAERADRVAVRQLSLAEVSDCRAKRCRPSVFLEAKRRRAVRR